MTLFDLTCVIVYRRMALCQVQGNVKHCRNLFPPSSNTFEQYYQPVAGALNQERLSKRHERNVFHARLTHDDHMEMHSTLWNIRAVSKYIEYLL